MAWQVTYQYDVHDKPQRETYVTRTEAEFAAVAWRQHAQREHMKAIIDPVVAEHTS